MASGLDIPASGPAQTIRLLAWVTAPQHRAAPQSARMVWCGASQMPSPRSDGTYKLYEKETSSWSSSSHIRHRLRHRSRYRCRLVKAVIIFVIVYVCYPMLMLQRVHSAVFVSIRRCGRVRLVVVLVPSHMHCWCIRHYSSSCSFSSRSRRRTFAHALLVCASRSRRRPPQTVSLILRLPANTVPKTEPPDSQAAAKGTVGQSECGMPHGRHAGTGNVGKPDSRNVGT